MNKDAIIILIVCVIAVILGAALFFIASPHGLLPTQSPAGVAFSVLGEGTDSGTIGERTNYRIKSEQEFEELRRMVYGDSYPPLPRVNFDTHQVLAIFDGTRPTGGYRVGVSSITDEGGLKRVVRIVHQEPGASCILTQAVTSPFVLVVVPKSEAAIEREDTTVINECE